MTITYTTANTAAGIAAELAPFVGQDVTIRESISFRQEIGEGGSVRMVPHYRAASGVLDRVEIVSGSIARVWFEPTFDGGRWTGTANMLIMQQAEVTPN